MGRHACLALAAAGLLCACGGYYEIRAADDTLSTAPAPGPIPSCISCHSLSPATDYLRGFAITN